MYSPELCTHIRQSAKIGPDMVSKGLLTSAEALELIEEISGTALKPDTFRSYCTRGQAPAPKEKIGRTLLWSRKEIEAWAANRPGRGARMDLVRGKTRQTEPRTDA
ncbi:helix-turn-helix transcriptional regulator [Rhodococcoides fascians]|uniref:helix-turn-helix transcriptional regulator n=1 Tax=Rhodococcoides fascians TaxID=1828 RepID=UPI00352FFBC1